MATVSSHILNAVDGSHADGISARLTDMSTGMLVAEGETENGGRLALVADLSQADPANRYQLTFHTWDYWAARGSEGPDLIEDITLLFTMPDPIARYHMPIILSPHGYSTWKSVPEKSDG